MIAQFYAVKGLKTDGVQTGRVKLIVNPYQLHCSSAVSETKTFPGFFKRILHVALQMPVVIRVGKIVEISGADHRMR